MNSLSTPTLIVNRKFASVKSKSLRIQYFLRVREMAQNIQF